MVGYLTVLGALVLPGLLLTAEAAVLLVRWRRGSGLSMWPVVITAGAGLLLVLTAVAFVRMAGVGHAT